MTAPLLEHALRTPDANSRARMVVQRKCGCGGSCGPCAEEKKKKKVQRHALGETASEVPQSVSSILGAAGRPLDDATRMSMESRFGRSFADVRVHTDSHAADSAKDINAAAYTSGTHIVFGAGRYEPHTPDGRRLLAHELAHVVQQRSGTCGGGRPRPPEEIRRPGTAAATLILGPADDAHERAADRIADAVVAQGPAFAPPPAIVPVAERLVQRKPEDEEEAKHLIVDDSATPAAGQMRRKAFVEELDAAVCATSREEMARLGQSTDGCPLLEQWRPRIRAMSTRQLEVSLRRWIGADAVVRTARDYIPAVAARLASSIRIWGRTGQVVGVPPDLMDLVTPGRIRIGVGGLIKGAIGSLFRKARDGAPAPAAPVALERNGRPLEGSVASRMGRAFGRDFSDVRVHTDAEAGAAAGRVHARAFTIGSDIAFANGEYAPGTIVGDALLAHELAHVAQQDGGGTPPVQPAGTPAVQDEELEHDADDAAVHAVLSLWSGLRRTAVPRLKSTLRLQRCKDLPTIMPNQKSAELFAQAKSVDCTPAMIKEIEALYPEAIARVEKAIDVLSGADRGDYKDLSDFDEQLQRHFGFDSTGPVGSVQQGFEDILAAMRNPSRLTFRCRDHWTDCKGDFGQGGGCEVTKDIGEISLCGDLNEHRKDPRKPFLFKREATSPVTKETHNEWVRTLIHEHAHTVCSKDYMGIISGPKFRRGQPGVIDGREYPGEHYEWQRKEKKYPPSPSTNNPDSYAWFAMEVSTVKR